MKLTRKGAARLFSVVLLLNIIMLLVQHESASFEKHKDPELMELPKIDPEKWEQSLTDQIDRYLPKQEVNNCICGLSTYFNPLGLKSKKLNYIRYAKIAQAHGLNLTVIELYSSDEPEIKGEHCNQYKTIKVNETVMEYPLWQKEALLNVGLNYLSEIGATCKNVAWLDIEIMMTYPFWIDVSCKALEEYKIIQPFVSFSRLGRVETMAFDLEKMSDDLSKEVIDIHPVPREYLRYSSKHGMVWIANREAMQSIQFFPYNIVGGGDSTLLDAMFNEDPVTEFSNSIHKEAVNFARDYGDWALSKKVFQTFDGKIGRLEKSYKVGREKPDVLHFWHGSLKNRKYALRWQPLYKFNYTPTEDIEVTKDGYITWSKSAFQKKPDLVECVKEYFMSRREEGGRQVTRNRRKSICEFEKKRKSKKKRKPLKKKPNQDTEDDLLKLAKALGESRQKRHHLPLSRNMV